MPLNISAPPPFFGQCFFSGAWKDCALFLLMSSFDFEQVSKIYRYYSLPRKKIVNMDNTL